MVLVWFCFVCDVILGQVAKEDHTAILHEKLKFCVKKLRKTGGATLPVRGQSTGQREWETVSLHIVF